MAGLRYDRAIGACPRCAEVIWTAHIVVDVGGYGVCVFHNPGRIFARVGYRQRHRGVCVRGRVRPWIRLGCCQMLLTVAIGWTAFIIADSLPFWPIDPWLSTSPWLDFQLDLVRCAWAIFPATCLWGASFPLAIAAVLSPGKDPGRLVGGIYAANTVGAIRRSRFQHNPDRLDRHPAVRAVLMGLSVAAGLCMFVPLLRPFRARIGSGDASGKPWLGIAGTIVLATSIGLAALVAWKVPVVPWELVAYGRVVPSRIGQSKKLYVGEGMNSSVAVSEMQNGVRNFHVSGKVEASSEPQDMRLERMLGHIPALLHSGPRSVLVVGCGAGITAGTFVLYPEVERIVICEIEPLIPPIAADYFGPENYNVLDDPRVRSSLRRRPALHPHHERNLRPDHVGPDSSMGQRFSHAVFEGILRDVPAAPQSGRGNQSMGALIRERRRRGEVRNQDFF